MRPHEAERRHRRHELGAVDERKPFLRLQSDRREPGRRERVCPAGASAVHERLALADEGQRQVRERREVAARPHRPTRRDEGDDAGVQYPEQEVDGLDPGTGVSLRDRVRT